MTCMHISKIVSITPGVKAWTACAVHYIWLVWSVCLFIFNVYYSKSKVVNSSFCNEESALISGKWIFVKDCYFLSILLLNYSKFGYVEILLPTLKHTYVLGKEAGIFFKRLDKLKKTTIPKQIFKNMN